ncbi:MAG: argininosuccinate lyase [Actinomycetota bacterium]
MGADETPRTLWHGRFGDGPAEALMRFTASIGFDVRLWADDIEGSRAHVTMLGESGILPSTDVASILGALDQVSAEFESASFVFETSDEDIHTAIERRVTEIAGAPGARIHTGRSRNDQVATALRLWSRREMRNLATAVVSLVEVLEARAAAADAAVPPIRLAGYTHLQHAQPVLLSHHLRAHAWALLRDVDRIADALGRADVSPLGAGALAGSSLPLDPVRSADLLGFGSHFANSLDAVSDRDFVAEYLFDLAMVGVHLSRIGEEWVLWTSAEFGFATLDDTHATGSSMMPQKKNPDIAELARGKTGRLVGNLTGLLVVLKGLPLAYNRDLQEDKEALFDSVDQVGLAVSALSGMIAGATFHPDGMAAAADAEALVATDLAEMLVSAGTPFRDAHAIVGALVRESLASGRRLVDLVRAHPSFGDEGASLFEPGAALARRRTPGASGPDAAPIQAGRLAGAITEAKQRLA